MRATLSWLVALGIVLAACSPSEADPTTTSEATTTTTTTTIATTTTSEPPPTTTTTVDLTNRSPINGTHVDDSELLDRRVLAVKMDNHPNARPQAGVERADMVIELVVEGVTRFITIWHHSDVEYLGPMRSGRPTDQTILPAFNEPTFAISGAQGWVQSMIRDVGVHLVGEVRPATFRISDRRAPHNLYTDTSLLREHADSLGYPDEPPLGPIWEFGPMPDGAESVQSVRLDFTTNVVEWDWDDLSGTWLRTIDGRESKWSTESGETERLGYPVLVVLEVVQYSVGGLPSSRTAGVDMPAFVFADGKVVDARWQRHEINEWFTLTDVNGDPVEIPEGQVWVSLVPGSITYE